MELVLIMVAAGVMYYLYYVLKDYLSNEENQQRFVARQNLATDSRVVQAVEMSTLDKVRMSEYGTLIGILGYVANADKEVCVLEKEMAQSLIEDMAKDLEKLSPKPQEELMTIFNHPSEALEALCLRFKELTKGEYKKKLKVVEFCFAMGYADGILNDATKEAILDIGAILELSNEDFNALYDEFLQINDVEVSLEEAQALYGYTPEMSKDELIRKYHMLIALTKQNILDEKYLNKPIDVESVNMLRKIQKAYEVLSSTSVSQMDTSASSEENKHSLRSD